MFVRLFIVLLAASLTACTAFRDPRDAAWDPRQDQGRYLHEQIPNWQHEALRVCGGGDRVRRPGMTDRC
jgi:hypothetical protein